MDDCNAGTSPSTIAMVVSTSSCKRRPPLEMLQLSFPVDFMVAKHSAQLQLTLRFHVCVEAFKEAAEWRASVVDEPSVVELSDVTMEATAVKDSASIVISWNPSPPKYLPVMKNADGTVIDMEAILKHRPSQTWCVTLRASDQRELQDLVDGKEGYAILCMAKRKQIIVLQNLGDRFRLIEGAELVKNVLQGGVANEFDRKAAKPALESLLSACAALTA
jgi:hypothetical protein